MTMTYPFDARPLVRPVPTDTVGLFDMVSPSGEEFYDLTVNQVYDLVEKRGWRLEPGRNLPQLVLFKEWQQRVIAAGGDTVVRKAARAMREVDIAHNHTTRKHAPREEFYMHYVLAAAPILLRNQP